MPPCPRCFTENNPGAAACVRCGSPLAPAPQYQQPQAQQYQQPQAQPYQQPQAQQPYAPPPVPNAQPMAAPGQSAYGAPPAPAQPLGAPGANAPGGGDADPERVLKLGGFPSKFGAAFCYLPCCGCLPPLYGIIALAAEDKQNKFVRFHAAQSLFLWAGLIVLELILFVLQMLLGFVIRLAGIYELASIFGIIFLVLFSLVGLVVFAGFCAGVVLAFMGKATRLPVIGGFAAKAAGL